MKRLTKKKLGSSYPLKNDASAKIGLFTDYDGFYAFFEAVNRLGEIEDILGDDYDLSRLRALVQADRDGRCVVLPVKTGDNIYFTFLGKIIKKQVFSVVTFCNSQRIYCDGTSEFFRPDDIGKTVFLTSEDAEGALKGEKHG